MDISICYDSTERGCSLCFKYSNKRKMISSEKQDGHCLINSDSATSNHIAKCGKNLEDFEIDLHEKRYFNDMTPLIEGCTCYCCKKYTRAYLHHLLVTKEMLASVLLMIHNLQYWLRFFEEIQECVKNGNLKELKEIVQDQSG